MINGLDKFALVLQRLYSRALAVYPAEFRHEYAAEMTEFFGEDCRQAVRRRGLVGLLAQGVQTFWDLLLTAPGVHMDVLRQDLRFAFRMLYKNPSFALAAVLALALGIGANATIFSLVHGILWNPLPFPEPGQLVMVWEKSPKGIDRNSVSPPNFMSYRTGARSLSGWAAFYEGSANLTDLAEPEHVLGSTVTPDFFNVLGVQPLVGSGLSTGPGERDVPKVVLSYGLWQRRYNKDPGIIGRGTRIDDADYVICGVMPESFRFSSREVALWSTMPPSYFRLSRQAHFLSTVARLKPGVALSQARAELDALAAGLAESFPSSNRGWGVTVLPLQEQTVGEVRRSLLILLGAVGFILLIACANVSNLLLARTTHRQGEIAIRSALGAGSVRIGRQLVTESVLLAAIGAGAGLILSGGALQLLKLLDPAVVPRLDEVGVDGWVIAFAFLIALLTGVLCGLAPAMRVSRADVREVLKEGIANRKSFAGHWLREALVTGEIALSLLLLVGAGLLIRTFVHLRQVDPGFQADHAAALTIDMPQSRYSDDAIKAVFLEGALARLRSLPGVVSAGMISNLPLTGGEGYNRFGFTIEHREAPPGGGNYRFYARWITPGYFGGMGIPILRGRDFSDRDRAGSSPAVIIDAALARRFFPGENPVGKFLRLSYANTIPREIVGVVGEVRLVAMEMEPAPQIYIPVSQEARMSSLSLVIRSSLDFTATAEEARQELHRIDKSLPVYDARPLAGLVAESIAPRRFTMLLMTLLAGLALILGAVGVYGVISYLVGERLHEIGIRMALGARPAGIILLVVRQGMRPVLTGIALGLLTAFLLTKVMAGLLFGVQPIDAWTFGTVALVIAAAACLACIIPALRASGVDPASLLRSR